MLERRISALTDAFEQRPAVERTEAPQVEAVVRGLADKIERIADAAPSGDALAMLRPGPRRTRFTDSTFAPTTR